MGTVRLNPELPPSAEVLRPELSSLQERFVALEPLPRRLFFYKCAILTPKLAQTFGPQTGLNRGDAGNSFLSVPAAKLNRRKGIEVGSDSFSPPRAPLCTGRNW